MLVLHCCVVLGQKHRTHYQDLSCVELLLLVLCVVLCLLSK